MFANNLIPPAWYAPIFHWTVCLCTLSLAGKCKSGRIYVRSAWRTPDAVGKFLLLVFILLVAFRPISSYFGDTVNYAIGFHAESQTSHVNWLAAFFSFKGEFLFNAIQQFCIAYADVHAMFFIFACIYFGCQYLATRRLFNHYWFIPFLVMTAMIDYWGFAVNGIRNGAAASLMILALTYRKQPVKAILMGILACGIHKSMLLVGGAAILSCYYNNTKAYLAVWGICILAALVAGGSISTLLAGSFLSSADARLASYAAQAANQEMMQTFSHTGFRPDFLLYSAIPIIVGYWCLYVKSLESEPYRWWLNIYIISNSFWVLMMYSFSSNRFAALSWFTAGIVLTYPFFKCQFSKNQGRYASAALLCWYCFTFYQNIIKPILR